MLQLVCITVQIETSISSTQHRDSEPSLFEFTWHRQHSNSKVVRLEELVHDVIGFISCAAPDLRQHSCSTTSTADYPLMTQKIYKLEA